MAVCSTLYYIFVVVVVVNATLLCQDRLQILKLGQSPLPSQRVLMLIAGNNHGLPVLDVFLTPQHA